MYRISFEEGNGYQCSCCRSTIDKEIDLETKEEVWTWLYKTAADANDIYYSGWEDDRCVDTVERVNREKKTKTDVTDEFDLDDDKLKEILRKRKDRFHEKKRKEQVTKLSAIKAKELSTLKRLINKYPEVAQRELQKINNS